MKKILVVLLAAVMVLSLVACAEKPASRESAQPTQNPLKAIAGTWEVEGISAAGKTLPLDQIKNYGLDLVITLKSDGTGSLATPSNPQFTATITYTASSAKYLNTEIPFTFDGSSHISLDYPVNGVTFSIVLKRA